jgi:hypothetical protein
MTADSNRYMEWPGMGRMAGFDSNGPAINQQEQLG